MKRGITRIFVLAYFAVAGFAQAHAQDPQYTQFYANQPLLNPAFTGAALGPRVSINYRAQWVAIPGTYRQQAFSYDQPILLGKGKTQQGLGGTITRDQAGEGNLSKLTVNLNYSFAMQFGRRGHEQNLRLGLGGGLEQASIDFQKLRFSDQIDPREGFIYATQEVFPTQSRFNPDIHFGAVYYNRVAWVGVSAHHLTQPYQTFITTVNSGDSLRLPTKFTATAGLKIPVGPPNDPDKVAISPAVIFMKQRNFNQLNLGAYVNIDPMVFGLWYRTNYNNFEGQFVTSDMLAGLIGFKQGIFSIGYSYDYTLSRLTNGISGGSHELALIMEFERNKPTYFKHRKMPCPRY
ncbi:MAG: PorP/SprF family type IX secretion system membrane protein [Bacteroidetes bacterium]|jgi:type IX secretion system PorP/SprF family membrane protein|nr:PorP/SprF family type IX secretion system membrane protein [Bacteroidota bacterium]MBL0015139.1 PorP/SprF family type IX secretion system membrane protein [Bacteroidota bacterium]MBP6640077.1 PorP/SprF family type IX secretion system membrane protein [Bacteroidia bacterium]MBP6721510.1 PorP/SprF family type IX secretion system membrane protein [Bacteroidia bacterium]MBP8074162.1 PorP/SprF family type IX secretion system membrane protein [Bacteroidia bacterium]